MDGRGIVSLDAAEHLIDADTLLVCVQAVNNETGAIQPISEIVEIAHERGALFHCDAVQALGKMPLDVAQLDVDFASFSGHKVYGPKGIGALVVSSRLGRSALAPLMFGGGQEGNRRPGTLNVPAIVGFGCACRVASTRLEQDTAYISTLRAAAEAALTERIPASRLNAGSAPRGPGTISLTLPGVPADILIANLTDVCIGEGSACNSGAPEPSHVLLAMGLSRDDAECTIRISLGRYTTESEVRYAVDEIVRVAADLSTRLSVP